MYLWICSINNSHNVNDKSVQADQNCSNSKCLRKCHSLCYVGIAILNGFVPPVRVYRLTLWLLLPEQILVLPKLGSGPRDNSCISCRSTELLASRFFSVVQFIDVAEICRAALTRMACITVAVLKSIRLWLIRVCCVCCCYQLDTDLLDEIVKRDPLSEISEQEKELLWRLR